MLGNERAAYGKQIVSQVATQLQKLYGTKGFDEKNIRRMMKFAVQFPEEQIVAPLVRQLSWSHFLIYSSGNSTVFSSSSICDFNTGMSFSMMFQSCFGLMV